MAPILQPLNPVATITRKDLGGKLLETVAQGVRSIKTRVLDTGDDDGYASGNDDKTERTRQNRRHKSPLEKINEEGEDDYTHHHEDQDLKRRNLLEAIGDSLYTPLRPRQDTVASPQSYQSLESRHNKAAASRTFSSLEARQTVVAIPATYQAYGQTSPGTVVGITLGVVLGIAFIMWVFYVVFNANNPSGATEVEVIKTVPQRTRRSRNSDRSEVAEVSRNRNRSPPRRTREIIVEETRTRSANPPPPAEDEDDIVEVFEEHSPARRPRRSSGYRTVDPNEFGGGRRERRSGR